MKIRVKKSRAERRLRCRLSWYEQLRLQRWRQAGLQVDFPLTPRRDMKAKPVQVRGHNDWSYAQETVVVSTSQNSNYINSNIGIIPEPTQNAGLYLYDRERLNSDYIRSHTDRIRESWLIYRDKL